MTDNLAQMLADIDSILETDFDTQLAVERDPYGATRAIEAALSMLRDQSARIEDLTAERDQWMQHAKNAVWADSEELEQAEADNARLREDLEELDFLRHEGGPNSVAAMEAELKRLRAVLSDIKTASVCSVSRHVAASALGEAAA